MDMEDGHRGKRQRPESDWAPPNIPSIHDRRLPPLPPAQYQQHTPQQHGPPSPIQTFPNTERNGYHQHTTLPPPQTQYSNAHSPFGSQPPAGLIVKTESKPSHETTYPPPTSQQFQSPRSVENGQYRSPPSINSPASYEHTNGNPTNTQPYISRPLMPPPPPSNINTRPVHEPRVEHSPNTAISASADGIYGSHFPVAHTTVGKKKAQRASQACDSCRSLKAKCDEAKPCQSCLEKGIECTYRQPEPKAQDKLQSEMSKNITDILKIVTEMRAKMLALEVKVEKLEDIKSNDTEYVDSKKQKQESDDGISPSRQREGSHESTGTTTPNARLLESEQVELDVSDEETADPLNPDKPKFGIQHTTNATELLKLPAISHLVEVEVQKGRVGQGNGSRIDRYLWKDEKKRGEIRQFGFGEGAKIFRQPNPFDSNSSQASGSEVSSPSTLYEYPFGGIASKSQSSFLEYSVRKGEVEKDERFGGSEPDERVGGLGIDGNLDLRESEVKRLVKSYWDKMNKLHPLLSKKELDKLVKQFLRETDQTPDVSREKNIVPRQFIGEKRKLDREGHPQSSFDIGVSTPTFPKVPQRSPGNAVVLLILGLGKICEYKKKKLPEVTWGSANMTDLEIKNAKGWTPRSSSPSSPISSAQPSPQSVQQTPAPVHTPSMGSEKPVQKPWGKNGPLRNGDVLPGFAYVAVATDIIGNELSGSTISHIQANILASLYFGQLVRPIQSHAYLHVASRAIQDEIRLKSSLVNLAPNTKFCLPKDNPLVYAFWTCLQLECDIVAELPCVHSGILGYEELMPYPDTVYSVSHEDMPKEVADSYDAQLWLRKHLNDIHAEYNPADPNTSYLFKGKKQGTHFASIEAVEESRRCQFTSPTSPWKTFTWDIDPEDDKSSDLATDILSARLRAKFYGARVITYRPFVQAILNFSWDLQHSNTDNNNYNRKTITAAKVDLTSLPGIVWNWQNGFPKRYEGPADASMERKVTESYGSDHWKFFERGIRALINSTTAFHGMESADYPRLIVTNVFGTAHAQWGNVLALLACYSDPELVHVLWKYLDPKGFQKLVVKTLKFLKAHAHAQSGLLTDIKILEAAACKAELLKGDELGGTPSSAYNLSFSSASSNGGEMSPPTRNPNEQFGMSPPTRMFH